MPNQKELSESLALALKHVKALHGTVAALMVDVAAMRRVVLNGPKKSKRYRQALESEADRVKPMVNTAMQAYDEEILRLKQLGQWSN